jgi:hypothetical protein
MAWKYFTRDEFNCKHCGENHVSDQFISNCDELRERCGFGLKVNSGYRCPTHNSAVSKTGPKGPHTDEAVDFDVNRERAFMVMEHAVAMNLEALAAGKPRVWTGFGFNQKGVGGRFLHLDGLRLPKHPRPTVWSY